MRRPLTLWLVVLLVLVGTAMRGVAEEAGLPATQISPSLSQIITQADDGIEPLVLVHGIGPDKGPNDNWDRFLRFAMAQPAFAKKFRVYLFHYPPANAIDSVVPRFQQAVKTVMTRSGQPHFSVMALSQGGLIVRRAYEDPAVAQAARRTLMIGSPLHGTPLANPRWIQQSQAALSPVKLGLGLVYHGTERKLPYFEQDFCWDNVDNGLDPSVNGNRPSACRTVDVPGWDTRGIITYGGFFNSTLAQHQFLQGMLASAFPSQTGTVSLPEYTRERGAGLLSRDRLFEMTQKKIAQVKLANAPRMEYSDARFFSMMVYNDGVTPLASALWLGRFRHDPQPGDEREGTVFGQMSLWKALAGLQGTQTARVFAGVDHQGWMLNTTRTGRATEPSAVTDWLNPTEPARPLFQWMVDDLLRQSP